MTMMIVKQAYTGKVLAELQMHDGVQVEQMLSNAQERHQIGRLPEIQRIEILQKLADLVEAEHEDFSCLIANEGGKPIRDARVEVTRAISGIRIAIRELGNIKGEKVPMDYTPAGAGHKAHTILEPIGVVVAVSAFNHPLNLAIHQVIPAIATGCPVIIKPASLTPLCTLRLAELIQQAGLPAGWVQVALLNNENAEKLVTDPRVAFFSFIGSAKVGWYLKSKLAFGTRCALEHGGVAPLIFDEYADEEGFVNGVVKASMYHSGQVCVSVQRVYVPEKRAQDLAEKIATIAARQVVGDAIDENTDLGPLISPKEIDRIEDWVNAAVASGAQLMTGGKRINAVSYAPTVLLNPAKDAKVSTQEVFAPVVCIYGYKTLEEAIEQANSLEVSFQSSVFSDNAETAMAIAKKLQASAVMINDYTTFRVDWMPFSGRKHSGYGIGGIGYSMRDMLEYKMIVSKG
ncbi:Glyceraldehyde-3-phosphate dehydrogenase (NADP(+)) (EC 1.2.1.9) [uncultured Gammaproteobacteria bacterium]|jgi:acyl-CoA reductase-like NAD-dependent aldehyde dehydrogenase|nr:Glyceraldehyde-3-phosphate dehydrogenase (NADP(+)) (EC 1.2.1.9) [uncultured Gammaproteobacteria bacterium]CAC9553230.1 Glyceraldehyde-3-phosphate dehydrogenase (NADP(+)) (EC 1.2.1.9) [uncultured Gammaproteobacteria bacterium]CAC9632586.1 Glyceraldehyde-3-phosphate dehydrogenase (NADP(+)) (EC 1.2.1.9) [uncultured Gammaproteobacteria bacterium]SHE19360.1 aldehyde dehydrogenase [Bathymodiolus brooksi thiotrophic gill symbiont]